MEGNYKPYKISYSNNDEILKLYVFLGYTSYENEGSDITLIQMVSENPNHDIFKSTNFTPNVNQS
jgi:hypothetical protein